MRSLDELQLADLDRLLWIYLRTLYTQHMLERFFQSTSMQEIQSEIKRLEERIHRLDKEPESANRTRIRQSLQGNLETGKSRLANLEKARENYDLLQAEIENLETKIQSITELAINRSDAEAITGQVEQITQGLVRTEQTINDLGFATGGESFDLTVPNILSREVGGGAQVEQASPRRRAGRDSIPLIRGHLEGARWLSQRNGSCWESTAPITRARQPLVRGDQVVFAVEEERFTRIKHAKHARVTNPDELPWNAIRECLKFVPESRLSRLDAIAYSLAPGRRLAMVGLDPYPLDDRAGFGTSHGESEFNSRVLGIPRLLAREANDPAVVDRFHFVPHHRAHAASAFYASLFPSAAILVIDGIGEAATAWLGRGTDKGLELLEEIPYPHSIGMLWERVAVYLGFTEFDACKVMGLAAYGDQTRFAAELDLLFPILDKRGGVIGKDAPPFRIDPEIARLRADDVSGLEALFGPRRSPGESPTLARFADVAAALQRRTEQAVLALAQAACHVPPRNAISFSREDWRSTASRTPGSSVRALFDRCSCRVLLTMPGPRSERHSTLRYEEDVTAREIRTYQPEVHTPFLGPEYRAAEIESALVRWGCPVQKVVDPACVAAALIGEGLLVGWFQGRMEFGPRALGNRCLLADPRWASIRDELNRRIKHREEFRPFGASVLAEEAECWFKMPSQRPGAALCRNFMNLTYPVHLEQRDRIPAVLHRDETCRVQLIDAKQNRLFHSLISQFEKLTGVPLVLNTSFNDQEPLVATPDDALKTFARSEIDVLFMGDYLVRRPT